jgi:hypothetical protein
LVYSFHLKRGKRPELRTPLLGFLDKIKLK